MTAAVFVDTNVFVYARDTRDPVRQARAAQWLEHLWRTRAGRLSVQVLNEYFDTTTRKLVPGLSRDEAWQDVQLLLLGWRPRALDGQLLERAYALARGHRLSWWDALIVAAAQLQDCVILLTEDLQDGTAFGGVTVRNPFKLALEQAQPEYGLAVAAPERHRSRGRPRRTPKYVST
jgi:predicted nucleic acid-binding protein